MSNLVNKRKMLNLIEAFNFTSHGVDDKYFIYIFKHFTIKINKTVPEFYLPSNNLSPKAMMIKNEIRAFQQANKGIGGYKLIFELFKRMHFNGLVSFK